jgi:hypothetical protein
MFVITENIMKRPVFPHDVIFRGGLFHALKGRLSIPLVIAWKGKGEVRTKLFMSKPRYHWEPKSQNDGRNGGDSGEDYTSGVDHSAMSTG